MTPRYITAVEPSMIVRTKTRAVKPAPRAVPFRLCMWRQWLLMTIVFLKIAALCSGHLQYAIICYSKSPCGSLTSECFGLKPSDFHPPHLQFSYVGNDYVTACLSASWYTHPDHRSLQPLKSAWHARNNKFSVIPCYTWLIDSPTWRTVHTKLTYT